MTEKIIVVDLETFRSGDQTAIQQKQVLLEALADTSKVIKNIQIQDNKLLITYADGGGDSCTGSLCGAVTVDAPGRGLDISFKGDTPSQANGTGSFALGSNCITNENYSTAIGKDCNIPFGEYSLAIGRSCKIEKGSFCTAIGNGCIIKGAAYAAGYSFDCFTAGVNNNISGMAVTCFGYENTIKSCSSAFVAGKYNKAGYTGKDFSVALGHKCT